MTEYRLYPLRTAAGGFSPPIDFSAAGDEAALAHGDELECPMGFEIWERARLVARVERQAYAPAQRPA